MTGPRVGQVVHDVLRQRVGVVMGHAGPYVQVRPLAGGREWDATPGQLRALTTEETLSAELAEVNRRSREGR